MPRLALSLSLCLFFTLMATAQEAATEKPAAAPETKSAAGEKQADKAAAAPTNRSRLELEREEVDRPVNRGLAVKPYKKMLPSGFREVLEPEQREEVYRIQESYQELIHRLESRIEALEKERDLAFQGVLKGDQKDRVSRFRATPRSLRPEKKNAK